MTKVPRWILNSLRAKRTLWCVSMLNVPIQVNSHEYKDGYETAILRVGQKVEQTFMRVVGRSYSGRGLMCCFECNRTTRQLAHADRARGYLRACGCTTCRVLLCVDCIDLHHAVHELAGENVWNWLSSQDMAERKTKEKKDVLLNSVWISFHADART